MMYVFVYMYIFNYFSSSVGNHNNTTQHYTYDIVICIMLSGCDSNIVIAFLFKYCFGSVFIYVKCLIPKLTT